MPLRAMPQRGVFGFWRATVRRLAEAAGFRLEHLYSR
jgi:hypothetical protein